MCQSRKAFLSELNPEYQDKIIYTNSPALAKIHRVFQKEIYNFESLHTFIQWTCTVKIEVTSELTVS
jgi:hypothetical protein